MAIVGPWLGPLARRRVRFLAKVLVVAELAYVLAVNLLLASPGFQHRLDPVRPGTRIRYETAWSPLPGLIVVHGLDYFRDGRIRQWSLHLDRGWAVFNPFLLPLRTVHFPTVSAEGVEVRIRKRPTEPRNLEREALLPPIEGIPLVPFDEASKPPRRAWRVRLGTYAAQGVRELWIDTLRWQGRARGSGGFTSRPRETATIFPSSLEMEDSTLSVGGRAIAKGIVGQFSGRSAAFPLPVAREGYAWLAPFTVSGRVTAEGVDGNSLDPFLPPQSPLHLAGGAGPITATLELVAGTLEPGTQLDWRPERLGVSFLDYTATGSGRLHAEVEAYGATVQVDLDHFELGRDGFAKAHLTGEDLTTWVSIADVRLDGKLEGGVRGSAAVERAKIPDFRAYGAYLPKRLGLEVTGGTGEVSARFELFESGQGSGQIELTAQKAAFAWEDLALRGTLRLDAQLSTSQAESRVFELTGTKLRLDDVSISLGKNPALVDQWWAALEVKRGRLQPGSPEYLNLEGSAQLRDGEPLAVIFGRRHPILAKLASRIESTGVTAEAALRLAENHIHLDSLGIEFPDGTVDGTFEFQPTSRRGFLLARWRHWTIGLELCNGERDWFLRGADRWWAAKKAAGTPRC